MLAVFDKPHTVRVLVLDVDVDDLINAVRIYCEPRSYGRTDPS
jgi:hypothetical protein